MKRKNADLERAEVKAFLALSDEDRSRIAGMVEILGFTLYLDAYESLQLLSRIGMVLVGGHDRMLDNECGNNGKAQNTGVEK